MSIRKPAVGQSVLFFAGLAAIVGYSMPGAGKPCAAVITCVHSDRCVNLVVFDANGVSFGRTSVLLRQDGDVFQENTIHAAWPDQVAMEAPQPMAAKPGFAFELNQHVVIGVSGEQGQVIGRAEYSHTENSYYVRYKSADGRAVDAWWSESALADGAVTA